jgi:hypothetical protein
VKFGSYADHLFRACGIAADGTRVNGIEGTSRPGAVSLERSES